MRAFVPPVRVGLRQGHVAGAAGSGGAGRDVGSVSRADLYYLCDRHQVLVCVFHDQDDDFSAVERQVSIVCTVMQCWWCTLMMVSGLEEAEAATEEARVSVLPDFVVVAIVTDIFTTIFEAFSKFEYRNIEIGRVITVPLFLAHLLMAAITTSGNAHREGLLAKTSWMFIVALACEWLAIQPLYVATRVFLYGVGCRCRGTHRPRAQVAVLGEGLENTSGAYSSSRTR